MALQSRDRAGIRPWHRARIRLARRVGVGGTLLAALIGHWALPAAAGVPLTPGLAAGETAEIKAVIDGDTLALADGRVVRLVGIAAPKPSPGTAPGHAQFAERAATTLAELALTRRVTLAYGGRRSDRYGRVLAQIFRDDGLWLQGELLARGLARVVTHPDNRALARPMLEREGAARDARLGIWATPSFAVRRPEEVRRHLDSFELVEGRVERVAESGTRSFLHFGPEDGRGFTAVVTPEGRRLLAAARLSAGSLTGRRLRVRGFTRWWHGPVIETTHPEQIELIGPESP